jgi:hypothetical protein
VTSAQVVVRVRAQGAGAVFYASPVLVHPVMRCSNVLYLRIVLLRCISTVAAVLQHLGIISSNNSVAGASGGAINAALTCSQVPARTQYDALFGLAARCRAANNCQGILSATLGTELSLLIPVNASKLCNKALWVSVTVAKPNGTNDTSALLGGNWNSTQEILAATLMSNYLPGFSRPSATVKFAELRSIGSGYEGGFTQSLPCPPGEPQLLSTAWLAHHPSTTVILWPSSGSSVQGWLLP